LFFIHSEVFYFFSTAGGFWASGGFGLAFGAGMFVVGIGASFLVLIGLEIVCGIFLVLFFFPLNITVQLFVNLHEAVQQILESLQVKG
ncbi:methyltransferase, partial [Bacillus cereus]|nr:methyltransferase [Bacillus cereus]